MELGLPTSPHGDLARRTAPIAGGGALVAAAVFVAARDPSSPGSPFPGCAFHRATGLWCPGCGLTRGTYQLLHGHVGAALNHNVFTPLAVVAVVIVWLGWVRSSWGGSPIRLSPRTERWLAITTASLLLLYGVLRNVPIAPLQALAP